MNGPIDYVKGDATAPEAVGPKIIAHLCNDIGGWGRGFVLALSKRWPEPEASYKAWHRDRADNDFGLGACQLVQVEPELWVANIVGQHGIERTAAGPPVRYPAMEAGLSIVATEAVAMGASVHLPRIGCGLAGGDWTQVEPLIVRTLVAAGVPVTVYDL